MRLRLRLACSSRFCTTPGETLEQYVLEGTSTFAMPQNGAGPGINLAGCGWEVAIGLWRKCVGPYLQEITNGLHTQVST